MAIPNWSRFILRAEIHSSSERVVAYGFDLTATSIFVVTEWHAAIGTPVSLRLSFPKILEPIDVMARISDIRAAGEPGEPGGIRLTFDTESSDVGARLVSLLDRVHAPLAIPDEDRPCRVLLVDDSWLIRDIFTYGPAKFFERPGALEVDHADDAEGAWGKLANSTYDLVIIDYFLPSEDGASLIAQMRCDERLAHTPIVAISVGGSDAREAMLCAGADVFLDKPLVFRDLFHTLRMFAERCDEPGPAPERKTALLFSASPVALALTRDALESRGFEVATASDLASFERQRVALDPDLILADGRMPEAKGGDVTSMVRDGTGSRFMKAGS